MTRPAPSRRIEDATDALDQLLALLDRFEPLESVLTQLVHSATVTIPDTASATITVLRGDQAHTAAASHPWAGELDQHQYRLRDGPCLHAARTGRLVRVDITDDEDWPEFRQAARGQQVAVAVGAPLLIDDDIINTAAALNLTTTEPHAFDPIDEALLELFTHALSAAVNHAYRHQQVRQLADQLHEAVEGRDVIGQAKGLLMAHHHCGPDEAFDYLRNASQQANIKLREVAAQLVERETPSPPGRAHGRLTDRS